MDQLAAIITHPLAMLLFGMATHFLKKLMQYRVEKGAEAISHPSRYFRDHPYQTALSVVGALAGYATLSGAGELTMLTAYGVGYMADSAADAIGGRAMGRVQGGPL